jgi:hypothetical protein
MFKKTALVAGIGLALSVTAQADYRWELGGGYQYSETDIDLRDVGGADGTVETNAGALNGSWYLENVDTSKGPLSEAAFLDHASDITLSGAYGESDFSDFGGEDDADVNSVGISSRYVAEGPGWKLSGWLVDLGATHTEPNDDAEIDTLRLGVGYYLTDTTTLVLNYANASVNNGGDTDAYSADLEHMWLMDNGGGFKARASYGQVTVPDFDDIDSYKLGGTWYFTQNFGIGADYFNTAGLEDTALNGGDGLETQGYQVNSEWFITENFAANLAIGQAEADTESSGDDPETNFARIGAKLRF